MSKKILIVTSTIDRTVDYIIRKYSEYDFFRFNLDQFSQYQLAITLDGFEIANDYRAISSEDCMAIYYRKPMLENLEGVIAPEYQNFIFKESYSAVEGLVDSFDGVCLSKPSIMRRANNKVYQLAKAKSVGFTFPELCITNSEKKINEFHQSKTIVKPLAVGTVMHENEKEFVQTNIYNEDCSKSSLKYAPSYFQLYAAKDFEVRATFVGTTCFAVKIRSENDVDWRVRNNVIDYEVMQLPDLIYDQCIAFMDACEMQFGCFDFIVRENNWFFLEMNANGQWAWLEFELGINISGAIMEYLTCA